MRAHAACEMFPLMSAAELEELADDIRQKGLLRSILLHRGEILDGRNRLRACEIAGVEPRFDVYAGKDPIGFVVSANLQRRHLDAGQRAMIAAQLAKLPRGTNQHASKEAPSQAQAAKLLSVSRASVQRAKAVVESGTPELVAAVVAGDVSVAAAVAAVAKPKKKPPVRVETLTDGADEVEELREAIRGLLAELDNSGIGGRGELAMAKRRLEAALPRVWR
jgi:hypothetical protein